MKNKLELVWPNLKLSPNRYEVLCIGNGYVTVSFKGISYNYYFSNILNSTSFGVSVNGGEVVFGRKAIDALSLFDKSLCISPEDTVTISLKDLKKFSSKYCCYRPNISKMSYKTFKKMLDKYVNKVE